MITMQTYRGVVQADGSVRLQYAPALPAGAEVVVVVAQPSPTIAEQAQRLLAMPEKEWQQPFEKFEEASAKSEPEINIADVSDDDLVALVHEVRQERMK